MTELSWQLLRFAVTVAALVAGYLAGIALTGDDTRGARPLRTVVLTDVTDN